MAYVKKRHRLLNLKQHIFFLARKKKQMKSFGEAFRFIDKFHYQKSVGVY